MSNAPWGGSEELWVKSAGYALDSGNEVFVSVYNWAELPPKILELKKRGAKILKRKKTYYGSSIIQRIKGLIVKKIISPNQIRNLKHCNPDMIVVSQGTIYECMNTSFLDLIGACSAKLKVIIQANSEYETIPAEFFESGQILFAKADKLFFVSERNRIVAERQLAMKFDNSLVVSNPANLNDYGISKWPASETLNMAFAGRLNATVKGLGVLLQILSEDKWKTRSWNLNLYGTGEDEDYLKQLVALYDLKNKVFFHGFVNDVKQIWDTNHVLLMPSTLEGTPLTLIEAMLCGRCAVVSDVGGNAELIEEGISGFVAEAPSLHSFGSAMERMWRQKNDLEKFGISASEKIKTKVNLLSFRDIIDKQ